MRAWRIVFQNMRHLVLALALLGLAAIAPVADAQAWNSGLGQFKHLRWTADDGAPTGVTQIIQTSDGYLWLSADALYRFDGVAFERIAAPAGSPMERASPSALMVSQAGELWVGFRDAAGVAVYRNGGLRDTRMPKPPRIVARLAQTPDGVIWASSGMFQDRLRRFAGDRWEQADDALGLPAGAVMGLQLAPTGDLWAPLTHQDGQSGVLARLPTGGTRFLETPYRLSGRPRVSVDPTGALWVADKTGTRMLLDKNGRPPSPAIQYPPTPNLRAATESTGVFYIRAAAQPRGAEHDLRLFGAVDGLTSNIAYFPFVDHEGSVWIATELGLDQFRPASALQAREIPADPINGLALAVAKSGGVYIASQGTLFLAAPGQSPRALSPTGDGEVSLCAARAGGVWMVQASKLVRFVADRREVFSPPPGGGPAISCAEDGRGRLWVALLSGKLVWRDAQGWRQAQGEVEKTRVWDMVTTPTGDLAFTTPADLAMMKGDQFSLTKLAPFGIGTPSMMTAGLRDIFVSGSGGLLRLRGGQTARLDVARFPWVARLRSLVQTPRGETWLISRAGISKVLTADLDRAFDDPRAPLDRRLFDSHDGLTSAVQHAGFVGTQALVGGDGRVWFLNREGAAFFDPAHLPRNTLAPPVAIKSLASGGRIYRDPKDLVLPPGSRTLDIAYAGLSLAVPQRVRFRYRLDDVDDDWVDPGARRLASYANLGPGHYRFQVVAANNDGVWNDSGATLQFEIRPTFFQSWPFKALCIAAGLGLLWLVYLARLRVVTERIRIRMAERIEERERIARELHDTLLQSVQTLTLRFQLAVDDLPKRAHARQALEEAIDRADQIIAEGRDRVRELRSSHDRSDIKPIIADIVTRQGFDPRVVVSVETAGASRLLDAPAVDEIGQIVSEALFNIWRHAGANRATVTIGYGADFSLRIADDGAGIGSEIVENGGRDGHFGLRGMRERALKLRGELKVRQRREGGTEVLLSIPGVVAYGANERRWLVPFGARS
jgi:signal transduction histidine kinase/ligand-binding sensor domain-containing protein